MRIRVSSGVVYGIYTDGVDMKSYDQNSALELRAVFTTEAGAPAVPTTCHWKLYCLTTNQSLSDWESVTVYTSTDEFGTILEAYSLITVPASLNAMQTSAATERKHVVISADKDLATERTVTEPYVVRKVAGR